MSETETGTDSTVGFVGVGNMGRRMAANLAKAGFSLVIRDTDADAQQRFIAAHGGEPATGPQSFARATVVVTMLPDGGAVREAMLGWEGGIAAALPSGAVVLDMSSADPVGTQALARDLAPLGIRVIDAPVSGGITRAESGTLSLMVGGLDDEAFARVSPVLETLGERIFRTGPLGSGHAMKALNNFLGASAYTTAAEALAIGHEFGLDPRVMLDVINTSTGRSFNTEVVLKDDVITGRYGTGFALGLLAKDVGIAADLAEAVGVDAPACQLVRGRWEAAAEGLGFAADHSEAHKRWWTIDLRAAD
ncbi:MAG TPA: NAD(P)-dependent oxidoreductase [Streptosporangiaceae bacterium]|jgi:3-hydroxyisobutyrate dehydrogenase|nr:NAD(P)-dependent oxidoreductase [Streptosporangiaceae bacterium]